MKFTAEVLSSGKNTTGIEVPDDVVCELGGGKRPKVVAIVNGYRYRSSVAVRQSRFLLSVSAEVRANAGVAAGDRVEVDLSLDTAERTVEVPDDLAEALAAAGVRPAFDALSTSNRQRHVLSVTGAVAADTRARRIAKVVADVGPSTGSDPRV